MQVVDHVRYIPAQKRRGAAARIKSMVTGVPYAQFQYGPIKIPSRDEYDVVVYDQFPSEKLVISGCKVRQICFSHDSMPLYFRRKAANAVGIVDKLYYELQSRYAIRAERDVLGKADKLVFVSREDSKFSQTVFTQVGKCSHIELGTDETVEYSPLDLGQALVFTGVMDYAPNEDAAIYFLREIYPMIKSRYPETKLYLVGRNPTSRLAEVAKTANDVVITGYVDSVYPYILGATVYVSPLRFGTGVKNKVLEAMKCGTPSVFSPVSIEAIPEVAPGENCFVASTTEEWIERVSTLLNDASLRNAFRDKLSQVFDGRRSWAAALERLLS